MSFELLPFTQDNLLSSLSNKYCPATELAKRKSVDYLFGYLSTIGARCIVIENDYVDGDYLDDFSSFYVKCFKPYDRFCKRLHFFSLDLSKENFIAQIVPDSLKPTKNQLPDSYLGFIVARPLPDAVIGRTVLKTYPDDGGRRNYPCTKPYVANLFGSELTINRSLAFQEQDTVLAACATVALWCCFHKTAELFRTPLPTPAAITRAANQVLNSRPIPSRGLDIEQMCNAIAHVGLEPEVFGVNGSLPLSSLFYSYIKMGIPVLLGVEFADGRFHAITLVGYSMLPQKAIAQEVTQAEVCIPMTGLRINEFYAHDDGVGPFARIKILLSSRPDVPIILEGQWLDRNDKPIELYPRVVVVPVYHKIRLTFVDIQVILTGFHLILENVLGVPTSNFEWDAHLTTLNDYKKSIRSEARMQQDKLNEILMGGHPRFIWRIELRLSGSPVLELLADATDMARSLCAYQLIWYDQTFRSKLAGVLRAQTPTPQLDYFLTRQFYDFLKQHTCP